MEHEPMLGNNNQETHDSISAIMNWFTDLLNCFVVCTHCCCYTTNIGL